jgi:transposase
VTANFPDECRYVLEMLGQGYGHDAEARERGLTPDERLRLHRERSGPVIGPAASLAGSAVCRAQNGAELRLGKAITYLLRHWRPLTLFLRIAEAPVDNNIGKGLKKGCSASGKCIVLANAARGAGR